MALIVAAAVLAGCSSGSAHRAPVEDRNLGEVAISTVDPATLPGAENAGKPGYYTVRPGDTIMRISAEVNQSWRDIASWNELENPNLIEVGQVLRVIPPTAPDLAATPITEPAAAATAPATAATAAAVKPAAAATAPKSSPPPSAGADEVKFIWPAKGQVIASFNETSNKGLDIGGQAGDSVVAAAAGRVVYAGAGLRGYGNLVIIKHNNTFLTAYAHNRSLLVKEDQGVKQGQKIAEMGSSDADRVKLHFEIRRSGKPVDPKGYLP